VTVTNTKQLAAYLNLVDEDYHDASDPYPSSLLATLLSIPAPVDKAHVETSAREKVAQAKPGAASAAESLGYCAQTALLSVA
jgi:hypothetical protein